MYTLTNKVIKCEFNYWIKLHIAHTTPNTTQYKINDLIFRKKSTGPSCKISYETYKTIFDCYNCITNDKANLLWIVNIVIGDASGLSLNLFMCLCYIINYLNNIKPKQTRVPINLIGEPVYSSSGMYEAARSF